MEANMMPNNTRKITITNTVKESLIFKTTTRAKRRRSNISMVEKEESRDIIMASQSKKKFMLFRKF